ncbi:uncharacterized protein EV422DRAFT_152582 [Fimicolochytrium jonesii]|uniref:uncharacterized protein n=1 Tax=Fimicolochytrium jonesii TaxID=1396493 RepID=UPI0022FEAF85|nr:uncharacterized protein EV422DRAFT_152582 [Fimicolochytrium jonesii]KAI8826088.1 hypothetical protein EV422DRAFT_152582 [Fimicolochytrium jonesii]
MCDAFHMFTGDMYKDYKARSSQQTMIIVGLLVVVVVVLVVAAVLFWMSLHHTKVEGRKWLKVLKGIPRSHLRHLTMDLEEEIEELFELEGLEDRAQTAATRHMETRLSHWLLQRYASGYVVSIFGLAALAVCLFAPPLLSSSQMDETATLILASNPRRFYGQVRFLCSISISPAKQ